MVVICRDVEIVTRKYSNPEKETKYSNKWKSKKPKKFNSPEKETKYSNKWQSNKPKNSTTQKKRQNIPTSGNRKNQKFNNNQKNGDRRRLCYLTTGSTTVKWGFLVSMPTTSVGEPHTGPRREKRLSCIRCIFPHGEILRSEVFGDNRRRANGLLSGIDA